MAYEDLYHKDQRSKVDCLIFDLDDTLYPLSSGIASECLKNIGGEFLSKLRSLILLVNPLHGVLILLFKLLKSIEYMVEKLGIEKSKVSELSNLLYKNYGTTMAGLRAIGYSFNYDDYHSFVHGRLPYEKLKPDPILRHLLLSLPIRKVVSFAETDEPKQNKSPPSSSSSLTLLYQQIFTNADKVHAARVLSRLGLEDCFQGIICFESLNDPNYESCGANNLFDIFEHSARPTAGAGLPKTTVHCKPSESAMELALKLANIDPQRAIFFDDSVRNIQAAKRIGLGTVLVGSSHVVKGADHILESIHNIKEALSELWEEDEKSEDVMYQNNIAIATSVTA